MQGNRTLLDQPKQASQGCLQYADAERSIAEFTLLVYFRMGGMVGGNDVYRTVIQSMYQGLNVLSRSQRRIDLGIGIITHYLFLSHGKVMRRNLGRNTDSFLFGCSYQVNGSGCTQVSDMQTGAGEFRQQNIAGHDYFFGGSRHSGQSDSSRNNPFVHLTAFIQCTVFTVFNYRQTESTTVVHSLPHQAGVHYGITVIAESYHSGLCQFSHFSQGFAFTSSCDTADG